MGGKAEAGVQNNLSGLLTQGLPEGKKRRKENKLHFTGTTMKQSPASPPFWKLPEVLYSSRLACSWDVKKWGVRRGKKQWIFKLS